MKSSILEKLESLQDRYEEVGAQLRDGDIIADQGRFRELSKEYAELEPVVDCYKGYRRVRAHLEEARQLLREGDAELREMAREEIDTNEPRLNELELELQKLLLPKDPRDN